MNRRQFLKLTGATAVGFVIGCKKDKKHRLYIPQTPTDVASAMEHMIDNYQDVKTVVGEMAPAEDVVGSIDIVSTLNSEIENKHGEGSVDYAVFDRELLEEYPFAYNLISVGNRDNNQITNLIALSFNPNLCRSPQWFYENEGEDLGELKGLIQFVDNRNDTYSIVATGRTGLEVRKACAVLADFRNHNLHGKTIYAKGELGDLTTEIVD